jgi:hypothetical protein
MTRLFAVLTLALWLALPAAAQDPVLMQIDADYESWRVLLANQYRAGQLNRAQYEQQLQTLDRNIELRRQQRYGQLEQADLRRREVDAIERISNQPRGFNCTTNRSGSTSYTNCY